MGFRAVTQARPEIFHGNNGYLPTGCSGGCSLDPIGKNPPGHLMKFKQNRISYHYGFKYWL